MHVVEHNVAGNENSLIGKPKHRVFVGVALDIVEDPNIGVFKSNEFVVEFADGILVGGCT